MNCINCQKQTQNPKFCSRSCAASYNNTLKPKKQQQGRCITCQNTIKSYRTYCDKCLTTRPIGGRPANQQAAATCLHCLKSIPKGNKYCSSECQSVYKFETRIAETENTGSFFPNTKFNTSTTFVRRYLRHKHGDKCAVCGLGNTWNNMPIHLILDHINGIPNDWSINNIRLVCPNCDSQLPTFKAKNKGNGRPYRKT